MYKFTDIASKTTEIIFLIVVNVLWDLSYLIVIAHVNYTPVRFKIVFIKF